MACCNVACPPPRQSMHIECYMLLITPANGGWETSFVLERPIFRVHVSFRGGIMYGM